MKLLCSALLCSALLLVLNSPLLAQLPGQPPAQVNAPKATVVSVTPGPSNGKINTLVSWENCVDPLGLDFVDIEIVIRPVNGNANGDDDIKKQAKRQSAPGDVLNANGSWAKEFTGLPSGATIIKASVWVFPKVGGGTIQTNMAADAKNVSVVVP